MTFDEYITNPMGRSNAVLSAGVREAQRKIYSSKFDNILLRENGKIDYNLYKGKGDVYYIHIKIPSEVVENFYYDVVLKFTGSANLASSTTGLDKYQVQFFSNDPAFVYTYAYVFRKKGLFIQELSRKMSSKALRSPANEKNPENQVGYVKSLFFAYLFMKNRGLFSKIKYVGAPDFNLNVLLKDIEDADEKIQKRQDLGSKVSRRKKETISKSMLNKIERAGGNKGNSLQGINVATTKRTKVIKNKASNMKKTKSSNRF